MKKNLIKFNKKICKQIEIDEIYELDLACFLSASGLAWQACLIKQK